MENKIKLPLVCSTHVKFIKYYFVQKKLTNKERICNNIFIIIIIIKSSILVYIRKNIKKIYAKQKNENRKKKSNFVNDNRTSFYSKFLSHLNHHARECCKANKRTNTHTRWKENERINTKHHLLAYYVYLKHVTLSIYIYSNI